MANLLITRHPANYHGLRRHLIASPFRAGKHFLMFVLIVMTVMALEMAVGFGVAIARFRARGSVEMEEATELQG